MRHKLILFAVPLVLLGCTAPEGVGPQEEGMTDQLRPVSTPVHAKVRLPEPKPAQPSDAPLARRATQAFWSSFHAGRYEALPGVTRLLTAEYLKNPHDPEIALLLAHAHLWKVSEHRRLAKRDPTITDHLVLAEQYFEEAFSLNPEDSRIIGWLGSVRIALGRTRQDQKLIREGYALLKEGVRRYPEFNHFTAGFVLSALPAEDERYGQALEHMWQTIELCSGTRSDRGPSGLSAYELAERADPACANTPKAPHNYEGFVLNFGDMLMKAGKPKLARSMYARAQLATTYKKWPYRHKVEQRLLRAEKVAELLARGRSVAKEAEILFGSAYSCVVCHAQ